MGALLLFFVISIVISLLRFSKDILLDQTIVTSAVTKNVSDSQYLYSTTSLVMSNAQGTAKILVDLAQTPADRTRGLSGRPSLENGRGMLFIFEKPGSYGFWMKDMNFSIDILWLDEQKKIVLIENTVSPETFPKAFGVEVVAQYVLEVPAGFALQQGVVVGDQVVF